MEEQAVPLLPVKSVRRSLGWYERLGFVPEAEPVEVEGVPSTVELRRGRMRLLLSEWDYGQPGLAWLALADAAAVREEFGVDDDDGSFELVDLDGNRLRVVHA